MSYQPEYQTPRSSPTNGLGTAGFVVSLVGIFTAGLLCPIGLLLSFFALFRRPRGFAVAGFIIGLIGTAVLAVVLSFFGFVAFSCFSLGKPMALTFSSVQDAKKEVDAYTAGHGGTTPTDFDGNNLISGKRDGWGHVMRYRRIGTTGFEIRSAGKDGMFGTEDDDVETFDIPTPGPVRVE